MSAGQNFGEGKSAPLIEVSTIFSKKSNDSDSTISYKSCGALDDVYYDGRPSVKALARKINENYKSSEVFGSSKMSKENNYCGHSGDRAESKILSDTDGDFVKRCVEDRSSAVNGRLDANDSDKNITLWEQQKSDVIKLDSRDDPVWQRIVDVVQANRIYYRCLTSIADAGKFQKVGDVAKYASSVLESLGQVVCEEGDWTQDWVDGCCAGQVSDGQSKGGLTLEKRPSYGANSYRIEYAEDELKNIRNTVKKLEIRVAVLQRDKRDLLNILEGYETENANKLSLGKRLKAEQSKNDELRAMISSVYDEKIRSLKHGWSLY